VAGILAMLVGTGAFAVMDAALKTLSPHYPPLQVAAMRGLASLPLVLAWVTLAGAWPTVLRVRFGLHLVRGGLSIIMLLSFVYALRKLSLADAYAIFFVAPLMIAGLSGPLLGERVDGHRWAALAVGLGGVMIVLRPTGQGMITTAGLAVLVTAVGYTLSALTLRVVGRTDSPVAVVFWLMVFISVGATALAWPSWRPVQAEHWKALVVIALSGTLGQHGVTQAFSRAQAGAVAPFEYTALLWGMGLDFMLWQSRPGLATLVGGGVVIGSGLYVLYREHTASNR
jgi:drug/metabolite transporter (DMT)-like permease